MYTIEKKSSFILNLSKNAQELDFYEKYPTLEYLIQIIYY